VPAGVIYLVEFLLVFCEDALFFGFVLPGETVLVAAAALASAGHADIWIVWGVAVVAAILGDTVGYGIGKRYGTGLRATKLGQRVGERHWDQAIGIVKARGGVSVFIGRWIALLRALVPPTAGMAGMRYRTFLVWNAIGGITWATVYSLVGYAAGKAAKQLAKHVSRAIVIALAIIAVVAIVVVHIRRHRRRARQPADPTPSPSPRPPGSQ
jgi:membrane protein DedA with SNARE-associated domain